MRHSRFVLAVFLIGLAACQRQPAGEKRTAYATPSPAANAQAPLAPEETAAPVESAPVRPAESEAVPVPPERRRAPSGSRAPSRVAAPPQQAPSDPSYESFPQGEPRQVVAPEPVAPPTTRAPEVVVLPAGTSLPIRLQDAVSSDKSRPEQAVSAELAEDVVSHGRVVLPAGSEVVGHVLVAQRSGRVKGRARLVVAFDEIRAGHRSYAIDAPRWDVTAASSKGRDAKIAGGAAAAGALIGAITGGGSGALKGGAIGGAAGGAAVLATRGHEVELPAGAVHKITLRSPLRLD